MRALILAAGQGERLRPHTEGLPKCLVPVRGRPLLEHALDALRAGGIRDIAIVGGYAVEHLRKYGLPVRENRDFATTNMVESLFCAVDLFDTDVLVVYGDILFALRCVQAMASADFPVAVGVNTAWREAWSRRMEDPLQDAETLRVDDRGCITEIGRKPRSYDDIEGQFMGLVRFSAGFLPRLVEFHRSLTPDQAPTGRPIRKLFMTDLLQLVADRLEPVKAVLIEGGWFEVDNLRDLKAANELPEDYIV